MYTLEHLYRSKIFLPTISLVVLKLPSNNICHRYPHAQRLVYSLSLSLFQLYISFFTCTNYRCNRCVCSIAFFPLLSFHIAFFSLSLSSSFSFVSIDRTSMIEKFATLISTNARLSSWRSKTVRIPFFVQGRQEQRRITTSSSYYFFKTSTLG